MNSRWITAAGILFVLVGTPQRAPAPIQEVVETPSPKPRAADPAPKEPSHSRPKPTATRQQPAIPKTSPTPSLVFAGVWTGTSGQLRGRTVVVNASETFVTMDGGPWGRESGPVDEKTTNQLVWTTKPIGVAVKWTLLLSAGGKTAQLTNKHFLGSETGTFQKKP